MRLVIYYLVGLVFGVGISISGMANPAKVLNFFDFAGVWDPSLAFVMGGAVIVTFIGYRFVLKRPAPMIESRFHLPTRRDLDLPLIAGSATFGVGWGISGFCPGGALPALGTGQSEVFIFVGALLAGIIVAKIMQAALANRASATA
jgi:uncharacterized membrane protein YedE/YeeE